MGSCFIRKIVIWKNITHIFDKLYSLTMFLSTDIWNCYFVYSKNSIRKVPGNFSHMLYNFELGENVYMG